MKITKIVATRWGCHILKPKCTKIDFGWAPPRHRWVSLQHSPDLIAGFKGPTSKAGEEKERGKWKGGEPCPQFYDEVYAPGPLP